MSAFVTTQLRFRAQCNRCRWYGPWTVYQVQAEKAQQGHNYSTHLSDTAPSDTDTPAADRSIVADKAGLPATRPTATEGGEETTP